MLPANINIANANLPAAYQAAINALAECSSIDECKDWSDKAAALASYGRQAEDKRLQSYALRIQARAVRRCGELLKAFQAPGARTDKPTAHEGERFTQRQIAQQYGISPKRELTAVRVANVSEEEFEVAVESEAPPSVTAFAAMGTKKRPDVSPAVETIMAKERPAGFAAATGLIGTVSRFAEFCGKNDPMTVAAAVMLHETADVRKHVAAIDAWLDRFVVNLGD